jgi:hypothetical protein
MVEPIIPASHFGSMVQALPPVMLLEMVYRRVLFIGGKPYLALRAAPSRTLAKMALDLHNVFSYCLLGSRAYGHS